MSKSQLSLVRGVLITVLPTQCKHKHVGIVLTSTSLYFLMNYFSRPSLQDHLSFFTPQPRSSTLHDHFLKHDNCHHLLQLRRLVRWPRLHACLPRPPPNGNEVALKQHLMAAGILWKLSGLCRQFSPESTSGRELKKCPILRGRETRDRRWDDGLMRVRGCPRR